MVVGSQCAKKQSFRTFLELKTLDCLVLFLLGMLLIRVIIKLTESGLAFPEKSQFTSLLTQWSIYNKSSAISKITLYSSEAICIGNIEIGIAWWCLPR